MKYRQVCQSIEKLTGKKIYLVDYGMTETLFPEIDFSINKIHLIVENKEISVVVSDQLVSKEKEDEKYAYLLGLENSLRLLK